MTSSSNFIIVVEEMLKYSTKERMNIQSLGTSKVASSAASYSALNPKKLPARPPNIFIPKNVSKETLTDLVLTPNSSRNANYLRSTMHLPSNRSANVTPDLKKKDSSFTSGHSKKPSFF